MRRLVALVAVDALFVSILTRPALNVPPRAILRPQIGDSTKRAERYRGYLARLARPARRASPLSPKSRSRVDRRSGTSRNECIL